LSQTKKNNLNSGSKFAIDTDEDNKKIGYFKLKNPVVPVLDLASINSKNLNVELSNLGSRMKDFSTQNKPFDSKLKLDILKQINNKHSF